MLRQPAEGDSRQIDEAVSVRGRHHPGKQRKVLRLLAVLALAPLVSLFISVVVRSRYRRRRARYQALSGGPVE